MTNFYTHWERTTAKSEWTNGTQNPQTEIIFSCVYLGHLSPLRFLPYTSVFFLCVVGCLVSLGNDITSIHHCGWLSRKALLDKKQKGTGFVCVLLYLAGPFLLLDWGVCHAHWNSVMRSPMCRLSKTNTTPNVFWIRSAQRDHLAPLVARLPLKLCVSDTCPPLAFFLMECGGLFRSFFFFPPSLTTKKNNKLSFLI